jgi:hypothetical protein
LTRARTTLPPQRTRHSNGAQISAVLYAHLERARLGLLGVATYRVVLGDHPPPLDDPRRRRRLRSPRDSEPCVRFRTGLVLRDGKIGRVARHH